MVVRMNELKLLRDKIDVIDDEMIKLFLRRMEVARDIAAYKQHNNMPVYIKEREEEKLRELSQKAGDEYADDIAVLYGLIFELSRKKQEQEHEKEKARSQA